MPTLPARYAMGNITLVFFDFYKQLGIYDSSQGQVVAVHSLVNGRKMWIDTTTNELVLDTAPSTTLFKTSYTMDTCGGTIGLSSSALIIGTNDQRGVTFKLITYPLTNLTDCPNVVLKYESKNKICIATACGDGSCSIPNSACKSTATVSSSTATYYDA